MPTKGFFTQTLTVLLERPATLDAVAGRLKGFEILRRTESAVVWAISGPSLQLAYRPEVNGSVAVDLVDQRWPDHMGDPEGEPDIFAAWATGGFGPGAWPGALRRACQHAWGWPEGRTVPQRHQAFLRIRSSYVLGAGGDAPVLPEDYDPVGELRFVTEVAAALLGLSEALCYFNPGGECVQNPFRFLKLLRDHAEAERLPLDLWSNVRFFRLDRPPQVWSLMDTVGMSQLDVPDHEACFQLDAYEPGEIDNFLRDVSAHVVETGDRIENGDTFDGPGETPWRGFIVRRNDIRPPRDTVRWFPLDDREPPEELLASIDM